MGFSYLCLEATACVDTGLITIVGRDVDVRRLVVISYWKTEFQTDFLYNKRIFKYVKYVYYK